MKNKEREVLAQELDKLRKYIDANPFLKAKYQNLEARIDEVYQGVLYNKVDGKIDIDEDGSGGSKRIQELEAYCVAIEKFVEDMQALPSGASSHFIPLDSFLSNKGDVKKAIRKPDAAFIDGYNAMQAYIDSVSTGLSVEELMHGLAKAAKDAYIAVKFDSIKKSHSYKALKNLGVPVIDNFVNDRKKYKTPPTSVINSSDLRSDIQGVFEEGYSMNEAEFDKDLKTFVDELKSKVTNVVKHSYEKCEIAADILAKSIGGKIGAAGTHPLFKDIQIATEKAIRSTSNGSVDIWGEYAKNLISALNEVQSVFATIDQLSDVNKPNFFSEQLKNIDIKAAFVEAVNRNSPYYIVGQPSFSQDFEKEMNTWKQEMIAALGVASKIVMDLDGATFNEDKFKEEILKSVDKDLKPIADAIGSLNMPTIKLREHKDISEFNEKWGTPWNTAMQNIDVQAILESNDVVLKAELYKNKYSHLPLKEEVQSALLKAVSDKVNLALEQARKNEVEIQKNRVEIQQNRIEIQQNRKEIQENRQEIKINREEILINREEIKINRKKIEKNTHLIKKLELKEQNINVDVDITIENVEINEETKNLLERFDKEWEKEIEFFKYDKKLTLYTTGVFFVELGFGASAVAGIKAEAKASELKADLTGYANVKGYVEIGASIGLDCYFFKIRAVELALGISLKAEAFVNGQIYVSKGPGVTAAVKAGFVVEAEAYFKVKAAAGLWESDELKLSGVIPLFTATTPQYSLTWSVLPAFKFAGAKKTKGEFAFSITPELKASLQGAKDDGEARDKEAGGSQR